MLDWQRVKVAQPVSRAISRDELARHHTADDCWMSINGRVYDLTLYLPFHPGGQAELMRSAGGDATQLIATTHAWINIDGVLRA